MLYQIKFLHSQCNPFYSSTIRKDYGFKHTLLQAALKERWINIPCCHTLLHAIVRGHRNEAKTVQGRILKWPCTYHFDDLMKRNAKLHLNCVRFLQHRMKFRVVISKQKWQQPLFVVICYSFRFLILEIQTGTELDKFIQYTNFETFHSSIQPDWIVD